MLSLDIEWLVPVSLLRSDRWLAFYMQPKLPTSPVNLRDLGKRAIADLQYYQAHSFREEDRTAALSRCFNPESTNCHELRFLEPIATQLLNWRGNAFEVKRSDMELWSALIAKVDPVWILASSYALLIQQGILTPHQMAALGSAQCHSGFPRDHNGKVYADNHAHLGGHGGSALSLLDFSIYLRRVPKTENLHWPSQPEFPLFSGGQRNVNELPLLVNNLFHYLASSIFGLNLGDRGSVFPVWNAAKVWTPINNGFITIAQERGATSPAQQLMLAAFDNGLQADHRWLLAATALLLNGRGGNTNLLQRYALRAYIHACNIFRTSMITAGVGLGEFVQYYGFSHRRQATEVMSYSSYAFSADSASNVLREFKVMPEVVARDSLKKIAERLVQQERQDRCHYVFHFSRSTKENVRADRLQRSYRLKLFSKARRLQRTFSSVALQNTSLPFSSNTSGRTFNLTNLVRGIDVAGNENDLPIEIFAPAIRVLRASRQRNPSLMFRASRQLHLSIHAGEDYSHLISGLRAVDETVRFCDYKAGDRIGHGLALGVSVDTWALRQVRIYLPLQEYVDNLVWCHGMALEITQTAPQFHAVIHILEQKIQRWSTELYGWTPSIDAQKKSWELRRNCPIISQLRSQAFGTEWEIWVPDMNFIDQNGDSEAVKLWRQYLRLPTLGTLRHQHRIMSLGIGKRVSLDAVGVGHCTETLSHLELELLSAIQDLLIERYSKIGIIIEACPTSNIYIARLNDYTEHPIFRWYPPYSSDLEKGGKANKFGLRTGPIKVCINTDDAGLMPTTIEHEHRLIKDATSMHDNASGDTMDIWINRIREIGVETFVANHLPLEN